MEARLLWVVLGAQLLVTAGIFLVLPRITRRGLLFGVYVGEERWDSDEARGIRHAWYIGTLAALAVGMVVGIAVARAYPAWPVGPLVSILVLVVAYPFVYLRAYVSARALGVPDDVPTAAAALVPDRPANLAWPLFAVAVGLACGALAIADAGLRYGEMPARVPTHFGVSGRPDAWAPKSYWTVMVLPLGTLIMGVSLGLVAMLTARAKRAIRARDQGVSVVAQVRFRAAMTRFLSGVAILTTMLLLLLSVSAVRVSIGQAVAIPSLVLWPMMILLTVYAIGGSLYLMIRYGQGGARLERTAGLAPLTNGLADNSRWILGMFYVNRDDPSLLVEKRFGLGYTVNFGNPRAVTLLLFLGAIAAFALISVVTSGS